MEKLLTSYLHDFGPDCTQHMFQALGNGNICTAVHMAVHRDDLTEKPNILKCNYLVSKIGNDKSKMTLK